MIAMVGGRRKSYNGGISRYQLAKGGRGIFGGRRDSARNLSIFRTRVFLEGICGAAE